MKLSKSDTLTSPWVRLRVGNVQAFDRKRREGRKRPRFDGWNEPPALLFPDQIKREKGVWWMPWQQEAMKDVVHCDKPWGAVNRP